MTRRALIAGLPIVALAAIAASRQQLDMEEMIRWQSAAVVHFKFVGDFSDTLPITNPAGGGVMAKVTDHVEIEFDWNQKAVKMVGAPVIRNSPTRTERLPHDARCPAPKLEGTYEWATILSVDPADRGAVPELKLTAKQDSIGGVVPSMALECGAKSFTPTSTTSATAIGIPPLMFMAMTGGARTPDGKSLITKGKTGEWTWTITPTIK